MSDVTPGTGPAPEPPATGQALPQLVPCPGCHAPRGLNIPACPHCGLVLTGDLAVALRRIDEQLYELGPALAFPANSAQAYYGSQEQLSQRYRGLLVERANTLAALYAMGTGPDTHELDATADLAAEAGTTVEFAGKSTGDTLAAQASGYAAGTTEFPQLPPPPEQPPLGWSPQRSGPETSPRVVQNTLLTLGAILVGAAAIAFTVFAWGQFSIAGRGAILTVLSLLVLGTPILLSRRDLRATAETLVVVGMLLLALDAYAAWRAVLDDTLPTSINAYIYSALAAGAIVVVAVLYRLGSPLLAPRLVAIAVAHAIPPLLALGISRTPLSLTLACLAVAAYDVAILTLEWAGRPVRYVCVAGAAVATVLGYIAALTTVGIADSDTEALGAGTVGAGFAVLVGLSSLGGHGTPRTHPRAWDGISAALAPLLLSGAVAALLIRLTESLSFVLIGSAVVGLVAAVVAIALPSSHRVGSTAGSGIVLGVTGVPLAGWLVIAAWAPVIDGEPKLPWDNQSSVGVRMLCAAILICVAWALLRWQWRPAQRKPMSGLEATLGPILVVVAVFTSTIGPIAGAPVFLLIALPMLGAVMLTSLGMLDTKLTLTGTFGAGLLLTVNAFTRGLVSAPASVGALTAIVAVYTAIAVLGSFIGAQRSNEGIRIASAVVASAALLGLSAPISIATDNDEHFAAFLLIVGIAVLVAVSLSLVQVLRTVAVACQSVAGLGAFVAVLLTLNSAFHCAVVVSVLAGLIAALAVTPTQRAAIWYALAVAPLAVALWLRVAEVRTAEAYTVPLALAALVGGVYAHHKKPERSSWVTFGPALALGMGPTLAITLFGEPDPLRALLLGTAALTVTTIGAFGARQAPFVLGALTVGAVAVRMVAPLLPRFTEHLPVWVPLAGAGLVLLIVGASYERGRRDMKRLVGVIRRMD